MIGKLRDYPKFLELIYLAKVQGGDVLVWKEDRKGIFNVKLYYSSLCVESRVDFSPKEILGSHAPLRSCFSLRV